MKDKSNVEKALAEINKKYGANTAMTVDKKENMEVEAISTNCFSLDRIFGVGGLPRGRILDIYGEFASGKTTLALYLAAQVQKQGHNVAWIDAEYAFTSDYAESVGVNTKDLVLVQPEYGERALDVLTELTEKGLFGLIVVDSTGALLPEKELKGSIEDVTIALQARMINRALRRITPAAAKNKTTIIFISQLRSKIGTFVGPTTDSTGGRALKFYSSVRIKVDRIKTLKNKKEEVIGNRLRFEATKNKIARPFKKAEIELYFEKGLDIVLDILEQSVQNKIIMREGNTYIINKERIVGRDKARDYLEDHAKVVETLKKELKALDKK